MKITLIYLDTSVYVGLFDYDKINGYNAVNLRYGYRAIGIYSPKSVITL